MRVVYGLLKVKNCSAPFRMKTTNEKIFSSRVLLKLMRATSIKILWCIPISATWPKTRVEANNRSRESLKCYKLWSTINCSMKWKMDSFMIKMNFTIIYLILHMCSLMTFKNNQILISFSYNNSFVYIFLKRKSFFLSTLFSYFGLFYFFLFQIYSFVPSEDTT